MRLPYILPTLLVLLCLTLAAPADAASYRVGIGDQSAALFQDSRFAATGIKRVRYLVPWDYARHPGQRQEVASFLGGVYATGREAFVTFTASRGCWADNRYSRASRCRAPSTRAYLQAFRAFRRQFPSVKVFAPWNEANHKSQPTASSPKRAASYYNALRSACSKCAL
jgi:hypothetical protein